jgi:aminoglycoside phosphotransferase (APT) family kinase protein
MEDKLGPWLAGVLPGAKDVGISNFRKLTEGFSYETAMFTARWKRDGKAEQRDLVVRIEPADPVAVGPCPLNWQFRILSALRNSDVPIPSPIGFEASRAVIGRPFMVVSRVAGEVPLAWGAGVEDQKQRAVIADRFVEALARVHRFDWQKGDLGFMLKGADPQRLKPAQREIERWEHVVDELTIRPEPILREALLWCKANKPKAQRLVLCHGDYRLSNFIWADGAIQALLDWEIATINDPMCDLGWTALRCWRGADPQLITGLLPRAQFYELYEKYSGEKVDPAHVLFWEVLGNVHMACILIQAMHGLERGNVKDLRLMALEQNMFRPILKEITDLLEF